MLFSSPRVSFYLFQKYFRGQYQKIFSLNSKLSFLGIFLSNALLIIIISVFDGLQIQLKKSILNVEPHISIYSHSSNQRIVNYSSYIDIIQKDLKDDIEFIDGKINSPGLLRTLHDIQNVVISSFPIFDDNQQFSPQLPKVTYADPYLNKNTNFCLLGEELATILNLKIGDYIELIVPNAQFSLKVGLTPSIKKFKIGGFFKTQHYEYDSQMVILSQKATQKLFQIPNTHTQQIAIKIKDVNKIDFLSRKILSLLREKDVYISTIKDTKKSFFSALQLEKTVMSIILFLFIIMGIFGVIFSLYNIIRLHKKDIGILKALGLSHIDILVTFTMLGFFIGTLGTILGILFGMFCATHLNEFILFIEVILNTLMEWVILDKDTVFWHPIELIPRGVYYFEKIPYYFNFSFIYIISFLSILLTGIGSFLPAYYASRLEPMEIIRGSMNENVRS